MDQLTIRQPDDWHLHLRDGAHMHAVLHDTARCFARAIVMPNLKPPVTTVEMARAYRQRVLDALPVDCSFEPLMTLYLTEQTTPAEIEAARRSGFIHGAKLYPAGATTHSDAGVRSVKAIYPVLERMEAVGLALQIHGEVTDPAVDVGGGLRFNVSSRLMIRPEARALFVLAESETHTVGVFVLDVAYRF